jgi:hypothetical protein
VVVGDFDVVGVGGLGVPREAETVLVVDADAVLTIAASVEGFEVMAWRVAEEVECEGGVEELEAGVGALGNSGGKVSGAGCPPERFCVFVSETLYHGQGDWREEECVSRGVLRLA